jgi:hypothetical protein
MMLLLLAQVLPTDLPTPSTRWEFWAVLGYLTLQSLLQLYQLKQTHKIEKQTNGLIDSTVQAAKASSRMEGELAGAAKEQVRIAAKLAISDEAAANLERIKNHSNE